MSHNDSSNWFDQTPDCAYLREKQLIGDKNKPNQPKLIPISRATLWRMVKVSKFPSPHQLGPNTTAWLCRDVRSWLLKNKSLVETPLVAEEPVKSRDVL